MSDDAMWTPDRRAADFAERLHRLGPDIIEAFGDLLARVELGQAQYGTLDLASNGRDWDREAYEELLDLAWYRAFSRLKHRRG